MFRASTLSIVALLAVAPGLRAQVVPSDSLVPGAKVRVTLNARVGSKPVTHSGQWIGATKDSLRIGVDGREQAFALAEIERLERATGKKGAGWKGAGFGAIGGMVVGAIWGAASYEEGEWCCGPGGDAVGGGVVGMVVGAGVGAIVGGVVGQTRWRWVGLPVSVSGRTSLQPVVRPFARGVAIGLRVVSRGS